MVRKNALYSIAGMIAVAAVFGTAGCSSPPPEKPEATAAAPKPAPKPEVDPITTVVSIIVRPDALELRDKNDAVVKTLAYDAQAHTLIEALSAALEEHPKSTSYEAGPENPGGVTYEWSGFMVNDFQPEEDEFPDLANLVVTATVPKTNGEVAISTQPGFEVGDDVADVPEELDDATPVAGASGVEYGVEFGAKLGPKMAGFTQPNAWAVAVRSSSANGDIEEINAPTNLGAPRM